MQRGAPSGCADTDNAVMTKTTPRSMLIAGIIDLIETTTEFFRLDAIGSHKAGMSGN